MNASPDFPGSNTISAFAELSFEGTLFQGLALGIVSLGTLTDSTFATELDGSKGELRSDFVGGCGFSATGGAARTGGFVSFAVISGVLLSWSFGATTLGIFESSAGIFAEGEFAFLTGGETAFDASDVVRGVASPLSVRTGV